MATTFEVVREGECWCVRVDGRDVAPPGGSAAAAEQLAIESAQALQRSGRDAAVVVRHSDGAVRATHRFAWDPTPPDPAHPEGAGPSAVMESRG